MAVQFTSCPACGAVGEIGSACQFCGTTIGHKEGITISSSRVVKCRTVTSQEFANKISIYRNTEQRGNLIKVNIGDQEGLVNLNGDFVYPLKNHSIYILSDSVIEVWGGRRRYINLETLEETIYRFYVKDKDCPSHLHYLGRSLVKGIWELDSPILIDGVCHHYDYAEKIYPRSTSSDDCESGIYVFHGENECLIRFETIHTCDFVVKSVGDKIVDGDNVYVPIELTNGRQIKLSLCHQTSACLQFSQEVLREGGQIPSGARYLLEKKEEEDRKKEEKRKKEEEKKRQEEKERKAREAEKKFWIFVIIFSTMSILAMVYEWDWYFEFWGWLFGLFGL